ncbi:class I SAM-dependent methyltransferase [Patulibacter defluvii]|uniref:class I SAM-dependent methyltransferase n=1 Tax=Patulibacter defluvii TaxID=3095358 RepID=UPI002A74E0B4|nr:methyltransferase domain-containing protein [Patulibacter sp. DM4]
MAEAGAADAHELRRFAYENPRPDVQAMVPAGVGRVLDLGCSSGALGAGLKQRDPAVEVVGVEVDPVYAARAATRLDRVETADVEAAFADPDRARSLVGDGFDCLICADVLEHLRDPEQALASAAALLRPGGVAIVSLPNVGYWQTHWSLFRHDRWPRHEMGIFDRTHLRWFTVLNAIELLADAGVPVADPEADVQRVMKLRPFQPSRIDPRLPRLVPRRLRTLVTFQHVLRGRRVA